MKKIAILQSNYIPWKGVFDMINQVDVFVFFEDVQYTRRDWRNRNKIKTSLGSKWLTVPVKKHPVDVKICDVGISENDWQKKHYNSIKENYSKAPFFNEYHFLLEEIYLNREWIMLSELNIFTTKLIADTLGIRTEFVNSVDLNTEGKKDDKIMEICKKLGATDYLSGPAAKDYISEEKFKDAGIGLEYIVYDYPEYDQLHGDFNHYVTVLDLIFNCGKESPKYIFQGKTEKAI